MTTYTVHSETGGPGQIHEAMAAILDELPAIGKDSTNAALRFNFRGIEAIVDALNPLLGKHGVVPVLAGTQLLQYQEKQKGYAAVVHNRYRFTARDGSFVEAQAIGEGQDFGDKAVAKANTMALKTCLGQVFCLAYEDDPDGDSVVDEPKAETKPRRAEKAAKAAKRAGATAPPPAAAPAEPDLQKARDDLWAKVDRLSVAEKDQLKQWLTGLEMTTDFDAFTAEQVAAIDKYVDDTFGEPF